MLPDLNKKKRIKEFTGRNQSLILSREVNNEHPLKVKQPSQLGSYHLKAPTQIFQSATSTPSRDFVDPS